MVRVGNNRPDLGVNPICNRFTGSLEEGRPLFLPCNPPMPGAFVSVHFEGEFVHLIFLLYVVDNVTSQENGFCPIDVQSRL